MSQFKSMGSQLVVASLILLTAACSSKNSGALWSRLEEGLGIFSNRSQTADQFIGIVKFSNPSLIESAQIADGKIVVDPDAKKALLEEQAQAESELKKLSESIQILFRYKMVLNGFAIVAPISVLEKLKGVGNVAYVESEGSFSRPALITSAAKGEKEDFNAANSVKWIGADLLHARGIRGKGVKVGIIDTGIDYTHSMFGGLGTEEAYKAVDPSKTAILFPNQKVVGGFDFAGTNYDSAHGDFSRHIPHPDSNPLDEAGHGTHVAGTVAGIGNATDTYDGVAPDAELYAIKVFGAEGATGDAVVIAGLEYAADPTGKGTGEGRLDVVNLSLGSPYGNPHVLYSQAARNLVSGGTVMVASAGNSGPADYIVGSPSVADEALSVAASVDNSVHNWQFKTVKFVSANGESRNAEIVEGPISKSVDEVGDLRGSLVYIGLADQDLSQPLKDQVKGKVAFIDRGKVLFSEKIRRAVEAGAIGVVVGNNQPGDPISMGGDGHYEVPAIMITQALAEILKADLKNGDVTVQFQTSEKVEKPWLIDTITGFSSKGPRSQDGLLKPEITAPGENVISAAMGKGKAGIAMSGTSMSGPHVAGAMALLRQVHPELSVAELKSIVMGRSITLSDSKRVRYPTSRQGAGRIQVDQAATSPLVASRVSLGFGIQNIEVKKMLRTNLSLKNISSEVLDVQVVFEGSPEVTMTGSSRILLAAGQSSKVNLAFWLDAHQVKEGTAEFDGWIKFIQSNREIFRIPFLTTIRKVANVQLKKVEIHSTSEIDSEGAATDVYLTNKSQNAGRALFFNLLGASQRKSDAPHDGFKNRSCDMKAAGYRIVRKTIDGEEKKMLQVAVHLFEPMTSWQTCEISVQIDSDGDNLPEQELALVALGNLKGLGGATNEQQLASVLLDAGKVREIRRKFEILAKENTDPKKKPEENYASAAIEALKAPGFNNMSYAVVEADISKLAQTNEGDLAIKVATIHDDASASQMDDFLTDNLLNWTRISLDESQQSFMDLPEEATVEAGSETKVEINKGSGDRPLLILTNLGSIIWKPEMKGN